MNLPDRSGRPAGAGACGTAPGFLASLPTLVVAGLLLLNAAGCAKSSDVERVDETNRVQDQRLKAIEGDVGAVLKDQQAAMVQLQREMQSVLGRMTLLDERSERMANEQTAVTAGLERSLSEQRKLSRLVEAETTKMARAKLDSDNEVDKMRGQVSELEKLLKSPISRLPAKTVADGDLREAYYHLINGEFDLAADRFEKFRKTYPKDERVADALYRRGQAFFLLRRYDHALIPFFELVDKAPQHALATPARWMLARALEETGDLKLAREFYAQLIADKTLYANDATRRMAFINQLYPRSQGMPDNQGQPDPNKP